MLLETKNPQGGVDRSPATRFTMKPTLLLEMSNARDMINAHLFPVLGLIATASSVSIALSLRPIAEQSTRWNTCYSDSLAWYEANKPDWTIQDKEVFASNFCNGGVPVKPGAGFQLAR